MVIPTHACIPALVCFLLFRLMYPSRALMPNSKRMPKYMPDRIASHCFKECQRIMGNDHPNLLAFLPVLMLLSPTQRVFFRACSIPSLAGMTLFRHVVFFPRNLKILRAMFSVCFESGKSFALEFSAHDNRILVLKFTTRNGAIFMSTELYDRLSGIIRKMEDCQVELVCDRHLIDLSVQISEHNIELATFFYIRDISLPFPMDYDTDDTCDFNIERYSLVSFWLGDEIPEFDRRCDERLNQKRIRDCEPSSQVLSEDPSEADSKRRKE